MSIIRICERIFVFLLEVILRTVNPQKAEIRRKEILCAARDCFEQRGFHSTTMAEICSRANISAGALYRYFDSKESIIEAIAEDEHYSATDSILRAIDLIKNGTEVTVAIDILLDDVVNNYCNKEQGRMAAELIAEAMRNPKFAEGAFRAYQELNKNMIIIFKLAQDKGHIDKSLDLSEAASMIMAAIDGLVLRTAFCGDIDTKTSAAWLKNLVRRYLNPFIQPQNIRVSNAK